jgi:hypothetical protein
MRLLLFAEVERCWRLVLSHRQRQQLRPHHCRAKRYSFHLFISNGSNPNSQKAALDEWLTLFANCPDSFFVLSLLVINSCRGSSQRFKVNRQLGTSGTRLDERIQQVLATEIFGVSNEPKVGIKLALQRLAQN